MVACGNIDGFSAGPRRLRAAGPEPVGGQALPGGGRDQLVALRAGQGRVYMYINVYLYIYIYVYIHVHIYIHMRKGRCGADMFGIFHVNI